jgi:hypothetical protein
MQRCVVPLKEKKKKKKKKRIYSIFVSFLKLIKRSDMAWGREH